MRKDVLAAGARKASFAGGVGESDVTRNIMSDEDRAALENEGFIADAPVPKPIKTFQPLGEVILVRRAEAEELSSLVITETIEKDKPAEGEVIAVGPDVDTVVVGDSVVFGKYAGSEFRLNGETLLLMSLSEILGTIKEI